MAVADKDIFNWFLENPNVDDQTIAAAMDQFKLKPEDVARATGVNLEDVASRYEKSTGITSLPANKTENVSGIATLEKAPPTNVTKWGNYDVNNDVVNNLVKQLQAQQQAGTSRYYQGEGFGSIDANTLDMARNLAASGVTDINQVAKGSITDPGYYTSSEQGEAWTPESTREAIVNKLTGKPLISNYAERTGGNLWSGTFAGKGNTGYGVQFDKSGNPLFYTQGASSNDLKALMDDLGPIGQIGLAIATGGLSIPEQIAANMAVQVLSGQDIGNAAKNAAISYAGAQIPGLDAVKEGSSFLKGIDSTGTLSNAFQNAVVSGGKALLSGKDIGDAMLTGAVVGGTNGAVNALLSTPEFSGLTDAQKKMAANAVTGVISGKPIDQVLINSAIAAANNAVKSAPSGAKSTTVGNFEDTEVSRLKGLGYDNKQIQAYFDRLDNITSALDNLDTTVAEPTDIVKTLDKAGLINTDEFLQSIGINNVDELKDSGLSNDDILRLINADIEGVTVTGNRDKQDQEVIDRSLGQKTTDMGNLTITDKKASDLGTVEVVDKKDGTNVDTSTTLSCPEGYEPNEDGTACIPVVEIKDKKCAPGFVYDEELQQCVPIKEKDTQTLSCPEGYEPNEDGTACIPVVVVEDKKCGPGFVYDEELKQCVPIKTDEKVVTSVTTPVTSVVQTPVKKAISPTTGFSMPEAAAIAATFNMPQLANVFYYGKDFSSKKQKLDKEGDVVEEEYKPLSVTAPGAVGELVEEQKNKENNANDALDLVLGKSGQTLSLDDLLNIVKRG